MFAAFPLEGKVAAQPTDEVARAACRFAVKRFRQRRNGTVRIKDSKRATEARRPCFP